MQQGEQTPVQHKRPLSMFSSFLTQTLKKGEKIKTDYYHYSAVYLQYHIYIYHNSKHGHKNTPKQHNHTHPLRPRRLRTNLTSTQERNRDRFARPHLDHILLHPRRTHKNRLCAIPVPIEPPLHPARRQHERPGSPRKGSHRPGHRRGRPNCRRKLCPRA